MSMVDSTYMAASTATVTKLDQSLIQDAMDFGSLPGPLQTSSNERSLYVSAWQEPFDSTAGKVSSAGGEGRGGEERGGREGSEELLRTLEHSLSTEEAEVPATPATVTGPDDSVWGVEGKVSMDIALNVRSLTVTFNKPEHPLAQGVVSTLVARVETSRGNLKLSGSLGQASVVDLTETGAYYRER